MKRFKNYIVVCAALFFSFLLCQELPAAVKYVTPTGASPYNGDDWTSAYSNIQDAVNACLAEASTIYVQTGRYIVTNQIGIAGAADLTIQGGCTGAGLDITTGTPTIITRTNGNIRLLAATNSTVKFNNLTFTNGFRQESSTLGFTIHLMNCRSTFTSCTLRDNKSNGSADSGQYGTAIYAKGGMLMIQDCLFQDNIDVEGLSQYGGAIYALAVAVTNINTRFINNTLVGNAAQGGALFLTACTNAWIEGCSFVSNIVYRLGGNGSGGAIYANGSPNLYITNCTFSQGLSDSRGTVITLTGNAQSTRIAGCTIRNNFILYPIPYAYGVEDIYINTTNRTLIENSTIGNGSLHGIYMDANGSLIMTNCLIAAEPGHGIWATTGSVSLVNCTIADTGGWGVTNGGGTVTILDSILWGNARGGVPTNRLTMNNSCAQEDHSTAGGNNLTGDPLFTAGYYLASNGLPTQTADSPCRDAGSVTAADRGLDALVTLTDGSADAGGTPVDLGFHYPAGFAESLSNTVLFVDAVDGSDSNTGWEAGPGKALKTITAALNKAIDNTTIYIAPGTYSTNIGEVFPLTIADNNIMLMAAMTNRDLTIINAGGAAVAKRALYSAARGRIRIDGVTITNGYSSAYARVADGGGLYILSCQTMITNCLITGNRLYYSSDVNTYGEGIYAAQGALTIADSVIERNTSADANVRSGGGLYANATRLTLRNVAFRNNSLPCNNAAAGGALYLNGGNAWIEGCTFATNGMSVNNGGHLGGAIYANGTVPLTITNCSFVGNGVWTGNGAALALAGAALRAQILNCRIQQNTLTGNGGDDVYLSGIGYALFKDTVIGSGARYGIYQTGAGSVMALTNCLISYEPNHGIYVASGTATVQNVTSAGHSGLGLTNTAGNVTVRDSIFWNNFVGGIRNAGTLNVNYTDSQETLSGTSNQVANPIFAAGFYLDTGSPCIDAGSAQSSVYGLDTRSTRIDGTLDSDTVDLGYHYDLSGSADASNTVLYVNVSTGDNANNGWSWGTPLKTITAALGKAIDGSVINIASGLYNTNSGESFPLVLADNNLSFIATNRDETIINGGGVDRIFEATSRGALRFESLTVSNGYAYKKVGAGFYLRNCQTTITNCTIVRNRLGSDQEYMGDKGGGIYVFNGSLALVDSDVVGQYNTDGYYKYGSGLYAENAVVVVRNVTFRRNSLGTSNPSFGGGVYLSGGSAVLDTCLFATNSTDYGGGLNASAVSPLVVTNCQFIGNVATRGYTGGAIYLAGAGLAAVVSKCDISRNTNALNSSTIQLDSGNAAFYLSTLSSNSGPGFVKAGSGKLAITNCLIYAQSNDALRVTAGSVTVGSCTLADNKGWGVTNSAIAGTVTVVNTIVWGNTNGGMVNCAAVSYSDSQEVLTGDGNKNSDPKFMNANERNYRLNVGSPCANAGTNEVWMDTGKDLQGRSRKISAIVDMGCYESTAAFGAILMLQ